MELGHNNGARYDLITRRIPLEYVFGENILQETLSSKDRTVRVMWATSPTGKPHIGYLIPALKWAEFLKADVEVTLLLVDVFSLLDNWKYSAEQVAHRKNYYKHVITALLDMLGINSPRIRIVEESSYYFSREFITNQLRLCCIVSQQDVRDSWDPEYRPEILSPMLCPGLQSLAEEQLDVDFQFGGADQRGYFNFAERFLPQLGFKKRAHLMNPMLPNLFGGKMSSSHPPHTKIMFLDSAESVRSKMATADAQAAETDAKNGILLCLRDIIIPISHLQAEGIVSVSRPPCPADAPTGSVFSVGSGEQARHFQSYDEVVQAFHSAPEWRTRLTEAVAEAMNGLLDPIRKSYESNEEWQLADKFGYPDNVW